MAVKHRVRDSKGGEIDVKLTPIKAIRLQCIECMGFQPSMVNECTSPLCSLFPFRKGNSHSGKKGGKGNIEGLKKYRASKLQKAEVAPKIDDRS
jgi:hypothetical protein